MAHRGDGADARGHRAAEEGIPTVYRNIRFRSRLEATWACWFDKVRWPWKYEPIDLRRYVPDFALTTTGGLVLVEVKPVLSLPDLSAYTRRLDTVGWDRDILLVGAGLYPEKDAGGLALGLLGELITMDGSRSWAAAPLGRCPECRAFTFCHAAQSFTSRTCGHYPGGQYPELTPAVRADLERYWAEAQNTTQWRP